MTHIEPFSKAELKPSDQLNHAFTKLVCSLKTKMDETGWLEQDVEFRDGINGVKNKEKIIGPPFHRFPDIYPNYIGLQLFKKQKLAKST